MKTVTTYLTSLFHDKHITASVCESAWSTAAYGIDKLTILATYH